MVKKIAAKKIDPKYTAALIIPIPNDNPVVVFKKEIGSPLREETDFQVPFDSGVDADCCSYWNGQDVKNGFPKIVGKHYPDSFLKTVVLKDKYEPIHEDSVSAIMLGDYTGTKELAYSVKTTKVVYDPNKLPKGCFEVALCDAFDSRRWALLESKIQRDRAKFAKQILSQYGFIPEKRGKIKKKDTIDEKRDKFIVQQLKSVRSRKSLPVKIIQKRWVDRVNCMFPDDPKKAEKYYYSDITIRRVLGKYMKK